MMLSEQSERYLTLINQQGDQWMTRAEIARLAGKKRLNPYEIAVVDLLYERGLIERKRDQMGGAIGFAWRYRALRGA